MGLLERLQSSRAILASLNHYRHEATPMTDTRQPYTRRSPEQWQALIDQWQHSGLSVPVFCKQHGLGNASFYKWRQRLTEVGASDQTTQLTPPLILSIFLR